MRICNDLCHTIQALSQRCPSYKRIGILGYVAMLRQQAMAMGAQDGEGG